MKEPLSILTRNWWALFLRGLVAIAFAAVAWARPGQTLAIVVILFGAYLVGDGIAALLGAGRAARRDESWWMMALEGLLGVGLGIFTLAMPVKAMTIAFLVIAIWALCTGVLELIEGARLRRHIPGEWLLMLSGLVRIAFGVLLLVRPGEGVLTLLWIAAAYALVDGIILIGLSFRLQRHHRVRRRVGTGGVTPQPA